MAATIGFDFDVIGHVAFLDLEANYTIGGDVFRFIADADSTPITVDVAEFDGSPVPVNIFTDPNDPSITHFVTRFTRPFTMCPCSATNAPFAHDDQSISLEMTGNGSVNAFHTFTVTLTPDDPNIVLTSTDGRIAGTASTAVPEPATLTLTVFGIAGIVGRSRRRRSFRSSAR